MRGKALLFSMLLSLAGCGGGAERPGTPDRSPILVFVAASAREPVEELARSFEAGGGSKVRVAADASSKLAQQIIEGAPADLFLSANESWAQVVQEKGFTKETVPLLGNSLVLVVPKDKAPGLEPWPDLPRTLPDLPSLVQGKLALAGPKVPAGIYARQALKKLGCWEALQAKVVSGDNVRTTLAYVERGEVDAGIVYATDALVSRKVRVAGTFPAEVHDPIRYPLVLLRRSADRTAARSFFDHLQGEEAGGVFARYGFSVRKDR